MRTVLLFILLLAIACTPSPKKAAGVYYARHNKGIEYIEMKENGTYRHYFKSDSTEQQQTGKWEFKYESGGLRLIFYDWMAYTDRYFNGRKIISSECWDDNVIGMPDEFPDECFYKIENKEPDKDK